MPHLRRPALAKRYPVHVTLRVHAHVWNLRTRRCFRYMAPAFSAVNERRTFRLVEYSIQGNHLHLLVEADDARCLARGLQSLEIRVAKGLNSLMRRRGAVFADRYHAHILRTPAEVLNALRYVRGNFALHALKRGEVLGNFIDPYSSATGAAGRGPWPGSPHEHEGPLIVPPSTWLLSTGWQKASLSKGLAVNQDLST